MMLEIIEMILCGDLKDVSGGDWGPPVGWLWWYKGVDYEDIWGLTLGLSGGNLGQL